MPQFLKFALVAEVFFRVVSISISKNAYIDKCLSSEGKLKFCF